MPVFQHRTIVFLIFLVSMSIIGIIFLTRRSCVSLSCLHMNGLASYKQKEIYENSLSTYRGLYQNHDELLRVEIRSGMDASEAQRRIDGQLAQIKTQYADIRAPYPGEITKSIACEEHYLPSYRQETANGLSITIVESFLTDRLTYGACTDEQATYRSILSLFYCPTTHQLYQLEFIAKKDQFNSLSAKYAASIRSLQCGSRLP